jgi:hypothetical protein
MIPNLIAREEKKVRQNAISQTDFPKRKGCIQRIMQSTILSFNKKGI